MKINNLNNVNYTLSEINILSGKNFRYVNHKNDIPVVLRDIEVDLNVSLPPVDIMSWKSIENCFNDVLDRLA